MISEFKKIFKGFSILSQWKLLINRAGPVCTQGLHLQDLSRGQLDIAIIYQVNKLWASLFQRIIFKVSSL